MKLKLSTLVLTVVCLSLTFTLAAESKSDILIKPDLKLIGLDLKLGYRGLSPADGPDTTLWLIAGGAIEGKHFYRLSDGTVYTGEVNGVDPDTDPDFSRLNGNWGLGIEQGLIRPMQSDCDLLSAFLYYRGRYAKYTAKSEILSDSLLSASSLPDNEGLLLNTLLTGLYTDGVVKDKRSKVQKGLYAETSLEWGPEFLMNKIKGDSNFIRANVTAHAFLPIYDAAPDAASNVFSLYAGTFFSVDYAAGSSIPIEVRQTFGGLAPRTGLGEAVRGVDTGRYDSFLKAVNNTEIRANFPALFHPDLVPGLLAFFDTGYYNDINQDGTNGLLFSTGAAFTIDLFDIFDLAIYATYYINGTNADGKKLALFTPVLGLKFKNFR